MASSLPQSAAMYFVRRLEFVFLICVLALTARAQSTLPVATQPLPARSAAAGSAPLAINLRDYFGVPGIVGPVVQFTTTSGRFNVELLSVDAPRHAANFLNYTGSRAYDNTVIHRRSNLGGPVAAIVQGGGYSAGAVPPVGTARGNPVALEYKLPNARGTLAAARTSDLNSATSEWYFNTADNSTTLGPANGGGYSVFGRVLGTGMSIVDAIGQFPIVNLQGTAFSELPVRNFSTGQTQLLTSNYIVLNSVRIVPVYAAAAGDTAVLTFTTSSSDPAVATGSIAGSTLALTAVAEGSANLTVRATDTNGNAAETTFAVTVTTGSGGGGGTTAPVFGFQPVPQTVAPGSTVVFNANASGSPAYQWLRNDTPIIGATKPVLVLSGVTAAQAGSYTVVATNAVGSVTSTAATLALSSTLGTGRLSNLAIRTNAGTGAETLIVGFAVGGAVTAGDKPLLVRGVGPSLALFGLSGVLVDPVATMFLGATTVAENDNWGGAAQIASRAAQVGAFNFVSASSLDAALAVTPSPNSYTVQVTGKGGGTGVALAEIYDATAADAFTAATPRLVNVSARTQVGTGGNLLIAGFVIGGTAPKTVLIRAAGPELAVFGIQGALLDPKLQLFSGATMIQENDDWGGDPQLTTVGTAVGAFAFSNPASKDALLLVTLAPGSYTAQVSGANNSIGIALVEVYEVP